MYVNDSESGDEGRHFIVQHHCNLQALKLKIDICSFSIFATFSVLTFFGDQAFCDSPVGLQSKKKKFFCRSKK